MYERLLNRRRNSVPADPPGGVDCQLWRLIRLVVKKKTQRNVSKWGPLRNDFIRSIYDDMKLFWLNIFHTKPRCYYSNWVETSDVL